MPCLLQLGGTWAFTLMVCRILLLQLYLFRGKKGVGYLGLVLFLTNIPFSPSA